MERRLFFVVVFSSVLIIVQGYRVIPSPLLDSENEIQEYPGAGEINEMQSSLSSFNKMLEIIMKLRGNMVLLVPSLSFPVDIDKRNSPDVGSARSYTGNRAVHNILGQTFSFKPNGFGKKKRDPLGEPAI